MGRGTGNDGSRVYALPPYRTEAFFDLGRWGREPLFPMFLDMEALVPQDDRTFVEREMLLDTWDTMTNLLSSCRSLEELSYGAIWFTILQMPLTA